MALADKLKKAAGLFIQFDEEPQAPAPPAPPPADAAVADIDRRLAEMSAELSGTSPTPRTVEQVVQASPGPSLDEIKVDAGAVPPPLPGASLDFAALYAAAKLPQAPFTAEQTLEMLAKLPANLPLDVKRQTMGVTLQAMGSAIGATAENIVADASRKLAALAAYAADIDKTSESYVQASEAEIARLTEEIDQRRQAILSAREKQQSIQRACDAEADRLDDVLEFFSLDIGPSKHASG
jgi:hypothetical protein